MTGPIANTVGHALMVMEQRNANMRWGQYHVDGVGPRAVPQGIALLATVGYSHRRRGPPHRQTAAT
jgi:hypothetical protein